MKKWRAVLVAAGLVIGASAWVAQAQTCLGFPPSGGVSCLCFGSCLGGLVNPAAYSCAGGPGASMIIGVSPAVVIHAGGGPDIVAALQPVQALCGGGGADVLVSAALASFVNGDGGNDVISSFAIANIANGGAGRDTVITLGGFGITSGGPDRDVCVNINGTGFPGNPIGDPLDLFGGFVPGDSLNGTCEDGVDL